MAVLQIKPLAGDAALADPADDEALGAFGVHHPDGRHRCGEDAILEPMAVLRILPDDEIIGSDGSLGAFGHGEPSCRSNRWPVMQHLERMPS